MMDLTARTLILDLLSTLRRGAMPVRALVEAGEIFGFAENNIRVTLSKLYAGGRITRDERGSYRLSSDTKALSKQLRRWRHLEEEQRSWRGDWVAVHSEKIGRGSQRHRRERALAVLGFRELRSGLHLRPDNLRGGVDAVRKRLVAIARTEYTSTLVYGVRHLDPTSDLRARSLWDADALTKQYQSCLRELDESRSRIASLTAEEALVESFVVGAGVVRKLILDPLLPPPILDPEPRRALLEATLEYDELGRTLWLPFLVRHGITHRESSDAWRATHGVVPGAVVRGSDR